MPGGSSLQMVSNKREALAASVTIALTNNTSEVLEARRQWVKGGDAFNLAVRLGMLSGKMPKEAINIVYTGGHYHSTDYCVFLWDM